MKYRIGTRVSRLATIQTEFVKKRLEEAFPGDVFETVPIRTKGDVVVDRPIAQIGALGDEIAITQICIAIDPSRASIPPSARLW